ncbi:MAG: glycosyltransferase [Patescibacteria group bacterium]|nr:glycosyltransferase [Patescibacteria group bacterium]
MKASGRRKILFVITKSNWGGAQRYVYDLAKGLPAEQFEVAVALGGTGETNAPAGLLAERLKEAAVRIIFLMSFTRDVYLSREFKAFLELLRVIKQERPDILHLNSSKAGGLGALAGRIAGVRNIIFTAHGFAHNEVRPFYERALIWIASWITILLAHRVIVLSNYELRRAPVIFSRRKMTVIYNGVHMPLQLDARERVRSAFPPGVRITGTVGELTRNKNQTALIEQAKDDPSMFVAIVGEGEEREHLEAKIKKYGLENRVKLFGFIPASEVLRGFDVFALPSLKEGLPYVLLEARAAGLPIVANRVGGVGEILDAKDMDRFSLQRMVQETMRLYR